MRSESSTCRCSSRVTPGDNSDTYLFVGSQIPVFYGPWYEADHGKIRGPGIVLEVRGSSFVRNSIPIIEVRSAADNRVYTVAAQPAFEGFIYPYSDFSTVAEDSSYTSFNAANNNLESSSLSQATKLHWRHRLDEATFYTVALALVSFDTRQNVNGQDPLPVQPRGSIVARAIRGVRLTSTRGRPDYYTDQFNPLYVTTSDFPFWSEQNSRTYSAPLRSDQRALGGAPDEDGPTDRLQ